MASRRSVCLVLAILPLLAAACAGSGPLKIEGDLSRPATRAPAAAAGGRAVAVLDFAYAGAPAGEVGRDFDNARPVVWKGDPRKEVPDLIAHVLYEKGVPVVRVRDESGVPADAGTRISGSVDEFRVTVTRKGTFKVEETARVALTIRSQAADAPGPWSTAVAAESTTSDPFYGTSSGVRAAVNDAANRAAEEAVKRLVAAGVVPAPRAEPAGGTAPR